MESFLERAIEEIRARVGGDKVICALSGGVDSAVAATLVARAIGEQLTCIFVDHGLLRQDEVGSSLAAFREVLHLNVVAVDARERFLRKLEGIEDPERKRVIIGHEFIDVFEQEAQQNSRRQAFGPGDALSRRDRVEDARRVKPGRRSNRTITSAACPRRWAFR